MYRRSIAVLLLSSFCLLGACVLVDDFPESTESTPSDRRALLEEQLPSDWGAMATSRSAPDAGFVVVLKFHEGGTQTLDLGWTRIEGTWLINENYEIELKYTGVPDQENIVALATIIDDKVVDLSVDLELANRGGKRTLEFRRTDGSQFEPGSLHGEWRTSPLDEDGTRLGAESDTVSYYGLHSPLNKKRYFEGTLKTFPCGSGRDCWALTESRFAPGVEGDDGTDLSGHPAPNLGGTIRVENGEPNGIYLPVIEGDSVTNQLLAFPAIL